MSNINFNSVRTGGQRPTGKTGPINVEELSKLVEALPVGDTVNVTGGAAAAAAELPAIFKQLSARDQQTLMDLPASVRQKVLAGAPADVEAAKYQIAQELLGMAKKLVPGEGISFEPARAFRVSDAAIAYGVLSNLSVADRQRLEGVTVERVKSTLIKDKYQNREAAGAAHIEVEQGRGFLGKLGFKFATLLEQLALTAPLGLMLRSWFPHALAEYTNRRITLGDAQAAHMKEVLTHEFGHPVQFGKEIDLASIKEWGKLSGWKDKDGNPSVGLSEEGGLAGFDPSVRPSRTDNFVYDNFTEDLSPQKLQEMLADIQDPELRQEFENSIKFKKTMQGAIQEIFGVNAKGYSQTSPLEDFAESYRAFYQDTELLVRKAPDKFLFLNAQSQRYTPDQVKVFFERSGKDPRAVATAMIGETGLTQDSIDRIFKVNGLRADAGELAKDAAAALQDADKQVPAFRKAFMQLQAWANPANPDQAQLRAFASNPAHALGALWQGLSQAERAQFDSPEKRSAIVDKMRQGQMSYVSAAEQGYSEIEVAAIKDFASRLFDDADFRSAFIDDPDRAVSRFKSQLPTDLAAALERPEGRAAFRKFADTLDTLIRADKAPMIGGSLRERFMEQLNGINAESLKLSLGYLEQDPADMAKIFAGLKEIDPSVHGT